MRRLSINLILPGVALIGLTLPLRSQAPVQKASIEVASIKPNNTGSGSSSTNTQNGYLRATNVTVKGLILSSYSISDFQLAGGPDWLATARFDIQAKTEAGDDGKPNPQGLIQALLEGRFQLKTHRETRELPLFRLIVAKGGPKIAETVEGQPGPGGLNSGSSSTSGNAAGIEMKGSGITLDQLIRMLTPQVGRPILDNTNLSGKFDFAIRFSRSAALAASAGGAESANEVGPDIFTAVQEQLGLKLESGKGPVEVLVIDSLEKPLPDGNH